MDEREKQSQVCAMLQDVDVFKILEKHLPFSERYSIETARSEPTSILSSRYIVCICQQLLQINRRIASGNRARGHSAEKIKKKDSGETNTTTSCRRQSDLRADRSCRSIRKRIIGSLTSSHSFPRRISLSLTHPVLAFRLLAFVQLSRAKLKFPPRRASKRHGSWNISNRIRFTSP